MEIENQDEVEIHISPVGEFYGSSRDGSPVKEVISQQSLEMIANEINSSNEEILVDVDHQSCKVGTEKNSRAFGWVKNLWTSAKGLFGKMKLTPYGKDLVVGREYRFLSPTFSLNDKGEPVKLHSIAATNTPNFDLEPILNTKPDEEIENMSKEDLKKMILEIMNECKNETPIEKPVEEPTVETKETVETPVETPVEETVETPVEEPKVETIETPVETPVEKPVEKTEVKTEKEEVKEEKEEVIKIEALNTTPTIVPEIKPEWSDLHGKAFFDYLKNHKI